MTLGRTLVLLFAISFGIGATWHLVLLASINVGKLPFFRLAWRSVGGLVAATIAGSIVGSTVLVAAELVSLSFSLDRVVAVFSFVPPVVLPFSLLYLTGRKGVGEKLQARGPSLSRRAVQELFELTFGNVRKVYAREERILGWEVLQPDEAADNTPRSSAVYWLYRRYCLDIARDLAIRRKAAGDEDIESPALGLERARLNHVLIKFLFRHLGYSETKSLMSETARREQLPTLTVLSFEDWRVRQYILGVSESDTATGSNVAESDRARREPDRTAGSYERQPPGVNIERTHVRDLVVLIHGANTYGSWQKHLSAEFQHAGFLALAHDYGRFPLRSLLRPRKRWGQLEEFLSFLLDKVAPYSLVPSVLAHSFGTILVCNSMSLFGANFGRLIFVGSIVRRDFDWIYQHRAARFSHLLNEVCGDDFWVRIARWFIAEAGRSGSLGFSSLGSTCGIQQVHPQLRHSDLLNPFTCRSRWIPFLQGRVPTAPNAPSALPPRANIRPIVTVVVVLMLVLAAVAFAFFLLRGLLG